MALAFGGKGLRWGCWVVVGEGIPGCEGDEFADCYARAGGLG